MGDLNLDAAKRPTITITTRSDAGETTEHHFEVLPLGKALFDAAREAAKRIKELSAIEARTDEQDNEAERLEIEMADMLIRSTNGPVTIGGLYEQGLVGRVHLARIGEYLLVEAFGNPPA